jgi:hypothetical protein
MAPVPESDVAKQIKIEISVQLAIQARQKVLSEARRNPLGVIVRREQNLGALCEIGAQQQCIARA